MKRILSIVTLFILIITSINAFDIYNSDDKQVNYFSINNPQVYVKTDINLTHFEVKYRISETNYSNIVDLINCDNLYCGDFSLLNLVNSANGTFAGATKFEIVIGENSEFIYFDFDKPEISLDNFQINTTEKNLELEFSYFDNSDKIDKIELYKKEESNLFFIADLTNETKYNYSLDKEGNLTLLFKITDIAQNTQEEEYEFNILDFFEPSIIESFVILDSGSYELNFKVEDKELDRYEVKKDDLKFSGELSGTSAEKSIILPFDEGKVTFYVFDKQNNYLTKEIDLDTKITNTYYSIYSNKKDFKFVSDANTCLLQKVGSHSENQIFTKSSNKFNIELDISSTKEYSLDFYCEKVGFRQYFTREFYYDTENPIEPVINVTKETDGALKLIWTDSIDKQTEVSYKLYRDSEEIYSGSRTSYTDYGVSYPNNYNYYVIATDSAGNEAKSDKIKDVIPQKTEIEYTTSLMTNTVVEVDNLNVEIIPEENSTVRITVKNNGNIISEKIIENSQSNINENLKFNSGMNQVIIEVKDEFGNIKTDTYFVTYSKPVLAKEPAIEEPIVKKKIKIENSSIINNNIDEETFSFLWILVILGLSIYGFYLYSYDEDKKKSKKRKKSFNSKNLSFKKLKKKKKNLFSLKRKNDSSLEKSLHNIKKQRINRQKELTFEKQKQEKKTRELTELGKIKHNDISKKESIAFMDFSSPKKNEKLKSKKTPLENIVEKSESMIKTKKFIFDKKQSETQRMNFNNLFKKKEKPKEDAMLNYINKIKSQKSWSNPREYLESTVIEKQTKQEKILKQKQEEESLKLKEINQKEENKRLKEEKKRKREEEKLKFEEEREIAKSSLDDYLNKRKSKKKFFFAERDVEMDLKSRK